MIQLPHPRWRPNRIQLLRGSVILAAITFLIIVICGYIFKWDWTGLVNYRDFPHRTLWHWLKLLIIPGVLAGGGLWFNQRQQARTEMSNEQRAQDEALQAYLDKMSELLIDKKLHERPDRYDNTRITARAQTTAVLRRLNGDQKRIVLLFLREVRLINREDRPRSSALSPGSRTIYARIVGLRGADLKNAKLRDAKLISTDRKESVSLEGAILKSADLQGADLQGADLQESDLRDANLRDANLHMAYLPRADLRRANLSDAELWGVDLSGALLVGANLRCADLFKANLSDADLTGANLSDADLTGADLSRVTLRDADLTRAYKYNPHEVQVANAELEQQAGTLEGAIMPNDQKYEEWLKDREVRGEERENNSP